MQRIQAVPERLIGVGVEVAVTVEGEADRGVPSPGGDLLGIGARRDPQGDRGMPQVVDAQSIERGRAGCRPPDAIPESGQPQRPTLRAHEHQIVGAPRTDELFSERLDYNAGEPDAPVASSGFRRPETQVAADLGDDLHYLDHPQVQVDTAAAKPSHLADSKAAIGAVLAGAAGNAAGSTSSETSWPESQGLGRAGRRGHPHHLRQPTGTQVVDQLDNVAAMLAPKFPAVPRC
jgi:hypothetical protein